MQSLEKSGLNLADSAVCWVTLQTRSKFQSCLELSCVLRPDANSISQE